MVKLLRLPPEAKGLLHPRQREQLGSQLGEPKPPAAAALGLCPAADNGSLQPCADRSAATAIGSYRRRWLLGRLRGPIVGRWGVRQVESPGTAVNLVKLQGPIDPLPEVAVLNRHHLAEVLPLPVILPPLRKPIGK